MIAAVILFAPAAASADDHTFETQLSTGSVRALQESALYYRAFGSGPTVEIAISIRGAQVPVRFVPTDIRSKDYKSEYTATDGLHSDPARTDLYAGTPETKGPADFARLAITTEIGGRLTISGFLQADGVFYSLKTDPAAAGVLFARELSASDLSDLLSHCGVELNGAPLSELPSGGVGATALKQAEMATEADYEYFQQYGSNQSSVNAAILSIMNGVAGIYEAQLNLTFSLTYQHVWTVSADPYTFTNSSQLLVQFENYWETNVRPGHPSDMVHLWTGKDLDSNVVGLAYLGTVCGNHRYGLSQDLHDSSYDVPLSAHEIGHNFNANHDSCSGSDRFLMCPYVIQNATAFSATSLSAINNFVASVSCLSTVTPPPPPPTQHAPVLAAIGPKSVSEYSTLAITLSGSDVDGDSLSYSFTPPQSGMSLSGSSFQYTPNGSVVTGGASSKTVNVTFTVSDGSQSASETVVVTVNSNNLAPVFASIPAQSASQGALLSYQLPASDPDGDPITLTATSGLPAGALLSSSGLFTWRPAGNQSGAFPVGVRVTDSYGVSANATLTVNVALVSGVAPLPTRHARPDFNGDGLADVSVYRPTTGEWFYAPMLDSNAAYQSKQFGLAGDLPLPGDYNGDRITDFAVFRPSSNFWYISYSGTGDVQAFSFGIQGDIPAPGDYDGDGRWDAAVFRPSLGMVIYRRASDGTAVNISNVGAAGDIPVPCDYDGDGKFDAAVFRPTSGQWLTVNSGGGTSTVSLGQYDDIPQPGIFSGPGACTRAVYRPSNGSWYIDSDAPIQFGLGEDVPAPADYDGDGTDDLNVFRPSLGLWIFRNISSNPSLRQLGLPSDILPIAEAYYYAARNTAHGSVPALSEDTRAALIFDRAAQVLATVRPSGNTTRSLAAGAGSYILSGDYDGDGTNDVAVYGGGLWVIYQSLGGTRAQFWGQATDVPLAGDFDGDGKADLTVFRPDNGGGFSAWYVIRSHDGIASVYAWGLSGDRPIAADFNGDGASDPTVWRESTGSWYVMNAKSSQLLQAVQWGLPGDVPRAVDFDRDGRADKVVWRPAQGNWFILYSSGATPTLTQWGLAGDVPIPGKFLSTTAIDFAVYRAGTRSVYIRSLTGMTTTLISPLSASAEAVDLSQPRPLH